MENGSQSQKKGQKRLVWRTQKTQTCRVEGLENFSEVEGEKKKEKAIKMGKKKKKKKKKKK